MGRSHEHTRRSVLAVAALAAAGLLAGCGGGGTSGAVVVPTTTSTTEQAPASVPSFGSPAAPLPPTAANAKANAQGACSQFNRLYVEMAQGGVAASRAQQLLTPVVQFAANAASGSPRAWQPLLGDAQALVAYVNSTSWVATSSQTAAPPVDTLYNDCRPLQ